MNSQHVYPPRTSLFYPSRALGWLEIILIAGLIVNALNLPLMIYGKVTTNNVNISMLGSENPVINWLGALIILGMIEWGIWLLWRVVKNARLGQVFVRQNVTHLRTLSCLVFAWAVLQHWLPGMIKFFTEGKAGGPLSSTALVFNWFTAALVFFLFAEVLRQGIRLKEEQDLTI